MENALWSLGVHDVAALLHLAGASPTRVTASGHCGLRHDMEDDVYLHLDFADGRSAHLHSSWLWPEDRAGGLPSSAVAACWSTTKREEHVTLHRKMVDAGLNNVDLGSEVVFQGSATFQPLAAGLTHSSNASRRAQTPRSDGRQAVDVVRILEQVFPVTQS